METKENDNPPGFLWQNFSFKVISFSIIIGVISGLAAFIFMYGLEYTSALMQGHVMGVHHPHPSGEEITFASLNKPDAQKLTIGWVDFKFSILFLLVPAIGGLISGILVYRYAPEAEGHGIDALINAFHNKKGDIDTKVPFIKTIASIITMGTGGSGGREGPIALIGGGFGSWLGRICKLSTRERRHFLVAGAAGGIGAIFKAPLGGAISSIEILYKEDFETDALVHCVVSSVTAFCVFNFIYLQVTGDASPTIFNIGDLKFETNHLIYYLILAVLCAFIGKIYVQIFTGIRLNIFKKLNIPNHIKPMIGGLLIGIIAMWMPQTFGTGMGYLQDAINYDTSNIPQLLPVIKFAVVLMFLKMLTVSITIGSGGSGGVFGPTLFIGGFGGFAFGCLLYYLFPESHAALPPIGAFVILGMASLFSAVANAPLGALVMASEMTGGYSLLAPLMLVTIISGIYTKRFSIYSNQVEDKFHSPAHLGDISFDILKNIILRDVIEPMENVGTIPSSTTLAEIRNIISEGKYPFPLAVKSPQGELWGMLTMGDIREALFDDELSQLIIVEDLMTPLVVCELEDDLQSILVKFKKHHYGRLPVISSENKNEVIGYIAFEQIMGAYENELIRLKTME
ncbi:MAG: chloride channel protein [Planctomycetota bacterium]|nr:MAG: chloride channel protein [Planctomycetota bacterium]